MELKDIKGLGPKKIELLEKLNIKTISDLVFYAPNYYEDRKKEYALSELEDSANALIKVRITQGGVFIPIKGIKAIKFRASDGVGAIDIVYYNQVWMKKNLKVGSWYYFFGKVKIFRGQISMANPIYSSTKSGELGEIVPVYPLTKDLSNKVLRNFINEAIKEYKPVDLLPIDLIDRYKLPSLKDILRLVHQPDSIDEGKKAIKIMSYIEAFMIQVASHKGIHLKKKYDGKVIKDNLIEREFLATLPFRLTGGQKSAIVEIKQDLESDEAMNRLLQGDVGSGKTVVGQYAAIKSVAAGYQVAFMAPTAILAEQNYKKIDQVANKFHMKVKLLTSSVTSAERAEIINELLNGNIDIIVGTHSLLNEEIKFKALGLVIIDEQHRFGVKQRAELIEKEEGVNLLVMSATPIPRSLALILYGEMDISEIRELPEGRQKIDTFAMSKHQFQTVNEFVEKELKKGRQAYYVCPLVEESEKMDLTSATELYKRLIPVFPDFNIAIVTGRTPEDEKNNIMSEFYNGSIDILVSTTVIEVGIDVPNASTMVIVNAERFGLSQLHQLRGRVGRGKYKSYCLLVCDDMSDDTFTRIKTMERSNDGFEIASEDLRLRGPGEFLGLKQSGRARLRFLKFDEDMDIIIKAKKDYDEWIKNANTDEVKVLEDNTKDFLGEFEIGVLN